MNPEPLQPPGRVDFPFEWREPADAELSWEWDDMHTPFALAPLAGDYFELIADGFSYRYEKLGVSAYPIGRVWNGYAYVAMRWGVPEDEREALMKRLRAGSRAAVPLAARYWAETAMPELRAIYDWIDGLPVAAMPAAELANAWRDAWSRCGRAWKIHFYAITGPYRALEDLADVYESVMDGAPAAEALRMARVGIEELQAMERGIERLTSVAADEPAIATHLRATSSPDLGSLARLPEAATLVEEVEAFLAEHGHMGQSFDDLALASWGEEPHLLIAEIRKRLDRPPGDPVARQAQLMAEADALVETVRQRLADRPDDLERFEQALGHAREIGPLTEGHNYWIDRKVHATLRRFVMKVGGRLAQAGMLEKPQHVLFLHRDEVPALLLEPADRSDLVKQRRETHGRQLGISPPQVLGRPADEPSGRFGGERFDSGQANLLKGTGASAGRVRAIARLTLGPDDFARVQPGEIIVCPSSNPSWVPLFAIAAGLVTDTGGVLSHAAVVAREFGLPAVVGTGDATSRIADGRMVELDGMTGDVRLL